MCEELVVVLRRGAGGTDGGLGVSLLSEPGPTGPHVICRVEDDSPAALSGQVEAGDVILKVNGTDVNRFSTKEVLKCLRLSSDPVTLKLKRDPQATASVRRFLSSSLERNASGNRRNHDRSCSSPPSSSSSGSPPSSGNGLPPAHAHRRSPRSGSSSEALLPASPAHAAAPAPRAPKFEAYMMTGELMLNLSRVEHQHNHRARAHHARYHRYNSTPVSPVERERGGAASAEPVHRYNSSPADPSSRFHPSHNTFNSRPPSPGGAGGGGGAGEAAGAAEAAAGGGEPAARAPLAVRTSRSEDQLQFQKEWSLCAVGVELEEDVTSSLNTLLDTRPDSLSSSTHSHSHSHSHTNGDRDRIVWTYNAPGSGGSERTHSDSTSISDNMSQRSSSPASPTSMSSSVMSSRATPTPHHRLLPAAPPPPPAHHHRNLNGDMSLSEAISNMSSPDYQDQDDMFEAGRECPRMEVSDPSDSDSTILVSEPCHKRAKSSPSYSNGHESDVTLNGDDYRIVIQVKGPDKQSGDGREQHRGSLENGRVSPDTHYCQEAGCGQALETASDEGSDAESLHSFHYSPKAVDIPSAERLAKRLYHLDGFKKSDVSRHLSKNNEFSRAVAEEYVKHFELAGATLDAALRAFLARFALSGETQERERVLVHFSRRYLECNPGAFNSQDAVHTLTCAIMLLNTDLHGGGAGAGFRRMSCAEFVDNLAELNDGENFPRDTLERLYRAIRTKPLQWAQDAEACGGGAEGAGGAAATAAALGGANPFLDVPDQSRAVEYKKGYVMRKCCYDSNAKKTPFGKRGWKMFYCTLRDLVLYLHKDEHGFRRSQMSDNLHNAIRVHHALATRASDYTKKQYVFRLQTADQAEYLFQTSDSKELASWIDTINFVCASHSAQPLASGVGSQRKFQRPLLPCSHTKLSMREQLAAHDERAAALDEELAALRAARDNTPHARDKEQYLVYEVKRYRTYASAMRARAGAGGGAEEGAPAPPERAPAAVPAAAAPPPP